MNPNVAMSFAELANVNIKLAAFQIKMTWASNQCTMPGIM